MIKSEMGNVEISGDFPMILADLSTIVFSLKEHIVDTGDMSEAELKGHLLHTIEMGFLSSEEIRGMGEQALEKMSQEERQDFLTEMVKEIVRENRDKT